MKAPFSAGAIWRLVSSLASCVWPSRKRRWRAQVVEFFCRDAWDFGVAGRVEVGVLAVEDEEFACGLGIGPAHFAWFFQEQDAAFLAMHAHAVVFLREVDGEGVERVVVLVDACCLGLGGWDLGVDAAVSDQRRAVSESLKVLAWPWSVWILHSAWRSVQNDALSLGRVGGIPPFRKMRERMGHPLFVARM